MWSHRFQAPWSLLILPFDRFPHQHILSSSNYLLGPPLAVAIDFGIILGVDLKVKLITLRSKQFTQMRKYSTFGKKIFDFN